MENKFNKVRIVTNYKIPNCDLWDKNVHFVTYTPKNWSIKNKFLKSLVSVIDDLILLIVFLSIRKRYDVLITYRDRASNIFSIIQSLFGKKIHHVMLNCIWRIPETKFFRSLRKANLKISASSVDVFAVFATHERKAYKEIFNLAEDKFTYIPYYFTPAASKFKSFEGDYIFSGGYHAYRDYKTLIMAVKDLDIKCKIATQLPEFFPEKSIPPNVEISYLPQNEYFKCMAASKMVVVPLKKDHFRSTGQRTYLNAMLMGKPLIVCDGFGAYDYIVNNEEGFIIQPGDVVSLKKTIQLVLASGEEIKLMAEKARIKARNFSVENTMGQILSLAQKIGEKKL